MVEVASKQSLYSMLTWSISCSAMLALHLLYTHHTINLPMGPPAFESLALLCLSTSWHLPGSSNLISTQLVCCSFVMYTFCNMLMILNPLLFMQLCGAEPARLERSSQPLPSFHFLQHQHNGQGKPYLMLSSHVLDITDICTLHVTSVHLAASNGFKSVQENACNS